MIDENFCVYTVHQVLYVCWMPMYTLVSLKEICFGNEFSCVQRLSVKLKMLCDFMCIFDVSIKYFLLFIVVNIVYCGYDTSWMCVIVNFVAVYWLYLNNNLQILFGLSLKNLLKLYISCNCVKQHIQTYYLRVTQTHWWL